MHKEDFTPQALYQLKLAGIGLHRATIFDHDHERYVDAYPSAYRRRGGGGEDGEDEDGDDRAVVFYDNIKTLTLYIKARPKEIALHAPLRQEELFPYLEWDTLRPIQVFVSCTVYSEVRRSRFL